MPKSSREYLIGFFIDFSIPKPFLKKYGSGTNPLLEGRYEISTTSQECLSESELGLNSFTMISLFST